MLIYKKINKKCININNNNNVIDNMNSLKLTFKYCKNMYSYKSVY